MGERSGQSITHRDGAAMDSPGCRRNHLRSLRTPARANEGSDESELPSRVMSNGPNTRAEYSMLLPAVAPMSIHVGIEEQIIFPLHGFSPSQKPTPRFPGARPSMTGHYRRSTRCLPHYGQSVKSRQSPPGHGEQDRSPAAGPMINRPTATYSGMVKAARLHSVT